MTEQLPVSASKDELEIPIRADRQTVWRALTDETNAWWLPDFHLVGEDSVVTLDARGGGHLIETRADGGSLPWYTVQWCQPGEALYLVGWLAPDYGGPATSMMKLSLEETEGGTRLRVQDAWFGHVGESNMNGQMEGWKQLFTDGLARHAERT